MDTDETQMGEGTDLYQRSRGLRNEVRATAFLLSF